MLVPINERESSDHESIGTKFDPVEFGNDLYNPETGQKDDGDTYPWSIEDLYIGAPSKSEKIYYGYTAMNHTPHVAYIVKDGIVIFMAGGTNIHVQSSIPNGIEVSETLDWINGKYKRTKYEYVDGKFIPAWYQISCDVTNKQSSNEK